MKIILYYLLLFVLLGLLTGFIVQSPSSSMSMSQVVTISVLLGLYVVAMSLVGEGKAVDERATHHRYLANRFALVAGTAVLSLGIIYQLFVIHELDYWLLGSLLVINLVKIISLIYATYRR